MRRCREIAHTLADAHKSLSVLILSGSPIIGSFDFRARGDFVRVPGVIKLRNGDYTSLALHIDVDQTMAMRASIMEHTAEVFDPDLFIDRSLRGHVEGKVVVVTGGSSGIGRATALMMAKAGAREGDAVTIGGDNAVYRMTDAVAMRLATHLAGIARATIAGSSGWR